MPTIISFQYHRENWSFITKLNKEKKKMMKVLITGYSYNDITLKEIESERESESFLLNCRRFRSLRRILCEYTEKLEELGFEKCRK